MSDLKYYDGTNWVSLTPTLPPDTAAGSSETCGRLTPVSGDPIGNGTSNKIYFTPYMGEEISLYDGTEWKYVHFEELSVSLPLTPSAVRGTLYDVYISMVEGDAQPKLTLVSWNPITGGQTGGTKLDPQSRATALSSLNGIYVSSLDSTKRFLGTIKVNGSEGTTSNTPDRRLIWNMSRRISSYVSDERDYLEYTRGPTNGLWYNQGNTDEHAEFINGLPGDSFTATCGVLVAGSTGARFYNAAIRVNGVVREELNVFRVYPGVASQQLSAFTDGTMTPDLGLNLVYAVELVDGTGVNQLYTGTQANLKSTGGIKASWYC